MSNALGIALHLSAHKCIGVGHRDPLDVGMSAIHRLDSVTLFTSNSGFKKFRIQEILGVHSSQQGINGEYQR